MKDLISRKRGEPNEITPLSEAYMKLEKCRARLAAADALAEVAHKAENVLDIHLQRPEIWEGRPVAKFIAKDALRELTAALREYREAK